MIFMDCQRADGERKGAAAGRDGRGALLVEIDECFLGLGQVAGCDVDVADEFVDVFGDDLELDGHVGESFAV